MRTEIPFLASVSGVPALLKVFCPSLSQTQVPVLISLQPVVSLLVKLKLKHFHLYKVQCHIAGKYLIKLIYSTDSLYNCNHIVSFYQKFIPETSAILPNFNIFFRK